MTDYYELLARLQKLLQPRIYVEIGFRQGQSFALAKTAVHSVAIDPSPNVKIPLPTGDALPSIGFCGQISSHRKNLMAAFETSPLIRSNFIKRVAFWGGNPHDTGLKADFWKNMQQNQFALAPRGAGNFSMRFYQALSVGRIPVLVNTDMALPFSGLIPWKDFIVFEENEKQCVRRLLEIFDTGQMVALQQMCYRMFHSYLSHKVFLGHLLQ